MTPDLVLVDRNVNGVTLPAVDGTVHVTPGRWPRVTALDVDRVEYWAGDTEGQVAIQGGIALFREGVLYVLTTRAVFHPNADQVAQLRQSRRAEMSEIESLRISIPGVAEMEALAATPLLAPDAG